MTIVSYNTSGLFNIHYADGRVQPAIFASAPIQQNTNLLVTQMSSQILFHPKASSLRSILQTFQVGVGRRASSEGNLTSLNELLIKTLYVRALKEELPDIKVKRLLPCLQSDFLQSACAKKVVFPSLDMGVLIRSPVPHDSPLFNNEVIYYFPGEEVLEPILNGYGHFENEEMIGEQNFTCRHRILTCQKRESGSSLAGAVHYVFSEGKEKFCSIDSIQVRTEEKGKGFGFLLFACVFFDALENECKYIKLVSSEEAYGFYEKLGFRSPDFSQQQWQELPRKERLDRIAQSIDLILDLKDEMQMQPFYQAYRRKFPSA